MYYLSYHFLYYYDFPLYFYYLIFLLYYHNYIDDFHHNYVYVYDNFLYLLNDCVNYFLIFVTNQFNFKFYFRYFYLCHNYDVFSGLLFNVLLSLY